MRLRVFLCVRCGVVVKSRVESWLPCSWPPPSHEARLAAQATVSLRVHLEPVMGGLAVGPRANQDKVGLSKQARVATASRGVRYQIEERLR